MRKLLKGQPANHRVQCLQIVRRFRCYWCGPTEHLSRALLQLPVRLRDLFRMNLELLSQFGQRAFASDSGQCLLRLDAAE